MSKAVQWTLQQDVIDRLQEDVYNASPASFPLGASSVPSYLYQSLKTIWSPSATLSYFQSQIVADLGTGKDNSVGSIVCSQEHLTEQAYDLSSFRSDASGAEVTPLYIIIYKPRNQITTDLMTATTMRIRYVLDNTLRGMVRHISGNLPFPYANYADNTLDPDTPIYCFWKEFLTPVEGADMMMYFEIEQTRLFTE